MTPPQKYFANTARTRAIRSSSSAASSVGVRPQAAGQAAQIARRDDRLRADREEPQPQRRPPEQRRSRRAAPRASPSATSRSSTAAVDVVRISGSAAWRSWPSADQQLDVHDSARIEVQVARAVRHLAALALDPPPHAAEIGPEARRRRPADRRPASSAPARARRAPPPARRSRRCAPARARPAPRRRPPRGGSARTTPRRSPAAPARPTGAGGCRPDRGAPPPASPPSWR